MSRHNRRLRIAHVMGMDSAKYGGLEQFVVTVARECARRGHRFDCVYEATPASPQFIEDLAEAGAELVVMPARGRTVRFPFEIGRWLYDRGIHVLHTHFMPASLLSLIAARAVQVPVAVCSLHSGWLPEELAHPRLRSRFIARARRSLAQQVLAVSLTVARQYRQVEGGGRRSALHYLGVASSGGTRSRTETRRSFGLGPDDLVVACVAFHGPVKGVDVLLRALSQVVAECPEVRLIQIGGFPDPRPTEDLKQLSRDLGLEDRVVWTGIKDCVRDILACADIYCQPSRSEGLPLAVLEAMDSGLPVVATRVGGIPEAVQHGVTGLLVPPESPKDLAQALVTLLRDQSLRRRMSERGRQRVLDKFLLERQVGFLVDLYEHMWQTVRF